MLKMKNVIVAIIFSANFTSPPTCGKFLPRGLVDAPEAGRFNKHIFLAQIIGSEKKPLFFRDGATQLYQIMGKRRIAIALPDAVRQCMTNGRYICIYLQ